ncbi:SRPBCC family protein [Catellatospora sichuanensis]|uniref:SRPBCC family protein n=1 Tax=Catellatospora sichuanensis TaxID=1969805 RepID=UPI0011822A75|nr:SRPBCC family protein [Catellatospora sichuanensis]
MDGDGSPAVRVSRRIDAPAAAIFRVLADPARHLALDGSGMLRGAVTQTAVTGVGDVFVMRMYYSAHGDYEMDNHVVEFEQDRRISWEPVAGRGHPDAAAPDARWGHRWSYQLLPDGPGATIVTESYDCSRAPEDERVSMDDGRIWIESMQDTLRRLDELCTGRRAGADA